MDIELLANIYAEHHRLGNRTGFTFGGPVQGELFAAWIGKGHQILDLGCRDGTLTKYYAAGNHIVGVDVDRQALSECKQSLGITTHWLNVSDGLPFDDASFDVVVAGELLEHLPFPDIVVAEVARVLCSGGLFIGSVPNAFRLKNRILFLIGREPESDPTHLRRFSISSLRRLLLRLFREIQIMPAFGRLAWLHGPLFANSLLWRCRKT